MPLTTFYSQLFYLKGKYIVKNDKVKIKNNTMGYKTNQKFD